MRCNLSRAASRRWIFLQLFVESEMKRTKAPIAWLFLSPAPCPIQYWGESIIRSPLIEPSYYCAFLFRYYVPSPNSSPIETGKTRPRKIRKHCIIQRYHFYGITFSLYLAQVRLVVLFSCCSGGYKVCGLSDMRAGRKVGCASCSARVWRVRFYRPLFGLLLFVAPWNWKAGP